MKEAEPPETTTPWKLHDVAASLHARLSTCDDVIRGRGYRLTFPEVARTPPLLLELYPARFMARYRGPLFELDLADVHLVEALTETVRIEARREALSATLIVEAAGGVTFAASSEPTAVTPAASNETAEKPREMVAEPEHQAQSGPEHEHPRVNLVGRVGAQPTYRTTPKGVLIGKFPLAVREGENKTRWHTVLAFGVRAVKIEEAVKKGDAVEVIGYKHERVFTKKDGSKKTVEEVYAVVVKARSLCQL